VKERGIRAAVVMAIVIAVIAIVGGNVLVFKLWVSTAAGRFYQIIISIPIFLLGLHVVLDGIVLMWVFYGKKKEKYIALGTALIIIGTVIMLRSFTFFNMNI
jgi:drug/metabolite transporter (DMT)-like permease